MPTIIVLKGAKSEKDVYGKHKIVRPFIGIDRRGSLCHLGIGVIFPSKRTILFWGVATPYAVIRFWRSMKILELVPKIDISTLYDCWTLACKKTSKTGCYHFNNLANQFENHQQFIEILEAVLSLTPTPDELERMISKLQKNGIAPDNDDIKAEVDCDLIAANSTLRSLLCS